MQPTAYADSNEFVDTLFAVLSNSRRRMLVRLVDQLESLDMGTAASYIAMAEEDLYVEDPCDVTSQQRHRVNVTLYQSHISKLADAGIFDVDERAKTISKGPNFDQACAVLSCVQSN